MGSLDTGVQTLITDLNYFFYTAKQFVNTVTKVNAKAVNITRYLKMIDNMDMIVAAGGTPCTLEKLHQVSTTTQLGAN